MDFSVILEKNPYSKKKTLNYKENKIFLRSEYCVISIFQEAKPLQYPRTENFELYSVFIVFRKFIERSVSWNEILWNN